MKPIPKSGAARPNQNGIPRRPYKSQYSEEQDAIIKKWFELEKSTDEESVRAKAGLVAELNAQREKEGFYPVNFEISFHRIFNRLKKQTVPVIECNFRHTLISI